MFDLERITDFLESIRFKPFDLIEKQNTKYMVLDVVLDFPYKYSLLNIETGNQCKAGIVAVDQLAVLL